MLICPQCQFENPNSNKFCQSCGTSLVHKVCHACGTQVELDLQRCNNCDAECGKIWLTIVSKIESVAIASGGVASSEITSSQESSQVKQQETTGNNLVVERNTHNFEIGSFIDSQRRYKIVGNLTQSDAFISNDEICLRVLDCNPLQVSPLEAQFLERKKSPLFSTDNISTLGWNYIKLYPERHKGIPPIHDVWQQNGLEFILIEDRSTWIDLVELWSNDTTRPHQILDCFYQMMALWEILEPLKCQESLLDVDNLKLDEDYTIALQKIYPPSLSKSSHQELSGGEKATLSTSVTSTNKLTIKNLGYTWHTLFKKSQRTLVGSFVHLLADIETEEITNQSQLRSRLETIAQELQPSYENLPYAEAIDSNSFDSTSSTTKLQLDPNEDTLIRNDDMPTIALPVELISLEDAGMTDVGRQRDHNEDYFGIETQISKSELPKSQTVGARGLYILCDGMGGHAGGEVASELAVSTLRSYFQANWKGELPNEEVIKQGIRSANQAIYDCNQSKNRSGVGRMGTTLVMVLVQDNNLAVAHVGDSRLYRFTKKYGLEQITLDHEVGQREIARGVDPEDAYARPDAYQLTQALGPRDENFIVPEVKFLQISEDALFILVSDGLSDNDLLESNAETLLRPFLKSDASLKKGVTELINLANKYNGHDNITTILVRAKVGANSQSANGL